MVDKSAATLRFSKATRQESTFAASGGSVLKLPSSLYSIVWPHTLAEAWQAGISSDERRPQAERHSRYQKKVGNFGGHLRAKLLQVLLGR